MWYKYTVYISFQQINTDQLNTIPLQKFLYLNFFNAENKLSQFHRDNCW